MLRCHCHRYRMAFTLVEMLAVLALASILMVAVTPALLGVVRGPALKRGGDMVRRLTEQARQTAMTKNTMTALVLLANAGTTDDYRAFTVLEYGLDTGWATTGAWERLPDGVLVDFTTVESSFLNNSPQPFPSLNVGQTNPPVHYAHQTIPSPAGYAARIFLPTGGLKNAESSAQLRLVEGTREGSGMTYRRTGAGGVPTNYYDIAIVGVTGVAKVSRP